MALDAPPRPEGLQIGRGGFLRSAKDTPYITDKDGATVKTGERKGEPKRSAYGSPSGFGKLIENTYNLTKWGERQAMLGIGLNLDLAHECAQLAAHDKDSEEFREAADRIVALAKREAKASLAADRGTHAHLIAEDHDDERDWVSRVEAGEDLGLDHAVQQSLYDAWKAMLERDGLEILASEAACVDDDWRLAGTLDRIARCTKDLRFALVTGETVVIPAGTVLVLDIKSGKRRVDRDGTVMYWGGYAIQIAAYAKSVPYDLETETRGVWPWEIDQTHALIAHLDVLGALDGKPACALVYVDLVAGREHGGECVATAKAWERRKDVFSVAQLPDPQPQPEVESLTAPAAIQELLDTLKGYGEVHLETITDPLNGQQHIDLSVAVPGMAKRVYAWAASEQGKAEVLTRAISDARRALKIPIGYTPAPPSEPKPKPDEGGPAAPAAVAFLQKGYTELDAAGATFIKELVGEAQRAHVPFHLKDHQTVRRFEIVRALVALATAQVDDGETVRCILASILGDVAHFPAVTVGHLVGSLDATEAALFATRCALIADGTVPATVRPDGVVELTFT